MNDVEFGDLVRDKSIALVGPASSTHILKQGSLIDSFDLVARCGLYYPPLKQEEVGSRTDIVCENFWQWKYMWPAHTAAFDFWMQTGVKVIVQLYAQILGFRSFSELNANRIPVRILETATCPPIWKDVYAPTKGILAIMDLARQPITKLFVTGFSFEYGFGYRKDYSGGIRTSERRYTTNPFESMSKLSVNLAPDFFPHNYSQELAYFKRLCRDNPKIQIDSVLEKLIGL